MMVHGCCWSSLVEPLPPFPRDENISFQDFCLLSSKMISFDISVYTGGTLAEAAKTTATSEHSTKVSGDRLAVNKQTNKQITRGQQRRPKTNLRGIDMHLCILKRMQGFFMQLTIGVKLFSNAISLNCMHIKIS